MPSPQDASHEINQLVVYGDRNQVIGKAINSTITYINNSEPPRPCPYGLPPDISDFTGRVDYIKKLKKDLETGGVVAISALNGMAGVGKSTLAIHLAHQLATQFPDAQLYINLRGQSELPLTSHQVLLAFLQSLTGLDESKLPSDFDKLLQRYRSELANKKALIVLDNAKDSQQVEALLPSSSTCAMLITSRQALVALAGVAEIRIDIMPPDEARMLFCAVAEVANSNDVQSVVELCGRLPLAIRIAGALFRRYRWTVEKLRQNLEDERQRLDRLEVEHLSLRTSFNLSYYQLSDFQKELFAKSGALIGQHFGLSLLTSVIEEDKNYVEQNLDELVAAQLLEVDQKRYHFHDLIHLFAQEKLDLTAKQIMIEKTLDWYCKWTEYWGNGLNSSSCYYFAEELSKNGNHTTTELEKVLPQIALDYFENEHKNLLLIVKKLTDLKKDNKLFNLVSNLARFFSLRSHLEDWLWVEKLAKISAENSTNQTELSRVLGRLGNIYRELGRQEEAIDSLGKSLEISLSLNNRHDVAVVLANLTNLYIQNNMFDEAISLCRNAYKIFCEYEDLDGLIGIMNILGNIFLEQGRYPEALSCSKSVLDNFTESNNSNGMAKANMNIGLAFSGQRKWKHALYHYKKALELSRTSKSIHLEGQILANIGSLYRKKKQYNIAILNWKEALTKLNPMSADIHKIHYWIENVEQKIYRNQYLLPVVIVIFLIICLISNQWYFALLGLGIVIWLW